MSSPLERIDMLDLTEQPPALVCAFFWSGQGLTCSSPEILERLTEEGIATPPEGERVFPRDGRKFFDALRWTASSAIRITPPRKVETVTAI